MWGKKRIKIYMYELYLHCLNEKNVEHVDDTVHYLLLIYQKRCKHSKKQLDAGKRKYKT